MILESLNKKQKIIFFIILSIMILFIIYYIYLSVYKNESNFIISTENTIVEDTFVENNLDTNNSNNIGNNHIHNTIIVYICGAVKESKVIKLDENSRISDAIDAVGGLTKDADITDINLAYILEDGEKIYIPKKGEIVKNENTSSIPNSITSSYTSNSSIKNNKININKATQTELETIPGIGPSTALKIIDYREKNGNFSSIEDIKNISGIGEAKYEKLKNYIRIK